MIRSNSSISGSVPSPWFGWHAPTVSPPVLPHLEDAKWPDKNHSLGIEIFARAKDLRDFELAYNSHHKKDGAVLKTEFIGLLKTVFRDLGFNEELLSRGDASVILKPVILPLRKYLDCNEKDLELILTQARNSGVDPQEVPYRTLNDITSITQWGRPYNLGIGRFFNRLVAR